MSVRHADQTIKANSEMHDVSAQAWNRDHVVAGAFAPAAHAASHQDGGADEVNVAALSGELADDQPPYLSTTHIGATAYVGLSADYGTLAAEFANVWQCDGTADEVEINLAIAYVGGLSGGTVHLEKGIYAIAASIVMDQNLVVLEGEGWATVLVLDNAVDDAIITLNANNCMIRDLQIDGNYANQTGGFPKGIEVLGGTGLILENLYIHDTYHEGIIVSPLASAISYGLIDKCVVKDIRLSGIAVYGTAAGVVSNYTVSNSLVYNCGFDGGTGDGIFFKDSHDCSCSNCVIDTTNDGGLEISAQTQDCYNITATGIVVRNITALAGGININSAIAGGNDIYNVTVSGFVVYDVLHRGVFIYTDGTGGALASDIVVSDGVIHTTGSVVANSRGVFVSTQTNRVHLQNLHIFDCYRGIHVTTATAVDTTIESCYVYDSTDTGILVDTSASGTSVKNCFLKNNGASGIVFDTPTNGGQIIGNTVLDTTTTGIGVTTASNIHVASNWVENTGADQINLTNSTDCTVQNNYVIDTGASDRGILATGTCHRNFITNNYIWNTTVTNRVGIAMWSGTSADDNVIEGNFLYQCATPIWMMAAAVSATKILRNFFIACTSPYLTDAGTDTILESAGPFPFIAGGDVDGTARWDEYVSATASAKGWEVDDAADWAESLGHLPLVVQEVVRIKVFAVALGAPIGAGGQMHVDINANAGASNLAYTTEAVALASFDSEEADYVANDVVSWFINTSDDADVGHMVGGMSIEVQVIYRAGADPDGATNAVFRAMELEYV